MGRRSRSKRSGTAAAIRRLNAAMIEVTAARTALAAVSVAGQQPATRHAAYAMLAANRQRLLATPGVLGVGLGRSTTRQPVIAVFTLVAPAGSHSDDALKLVQPGLRALPETGTQLVPLEGLLARPERSSHASPGSLDRAFDVATSTTLSSGSGIGQADPATRGTLGALALTSDDAVVAITAMHLVDTREVGAGDPTVPMVTRATVDDAGIAVGDIDLGTRTGVDAARVRIAADVDVSWDIPTIGDVRGWRWPAYPADIGLGVRLYGARSGRLDGTITQVDAEFPEFSLQRTIVASIPTAHGDSGGALVDPDGYILGFLVGASSDLDSSLRLFSPAGLVLHHLDCNIP